MASDTRWAPVSLEYIWADSVASIRLTTSKPVHLSLRYTYKEPVRTSVPRQKRGAFWYADLKFCFVEWADCEQDEVGDTLVHTFTCDIFPYCVKVWFVFLGTIGGIMSASNTAVFKAHNPWPPPPPPEVCALSLTGRYEAGPGQARTATITTSLTHAVV